MLLSSEQFTLVVTATKYQSLTLVRGSVKMVSPKSQKALDAAKLPHKKKMNPMTMLWFHAPQQH